MSGADPNVNAKPEPVSPWLSSRGDVSLTRVGLGVIGLIDNHCRGYTLPGDRDRLVRDVGLKGRVARDEASLAQWLDEATAPPSMP
jgi:hypothetical protein